MPEPTDVMKRFFLFFPLSGDVGAVVCPRKALMAPAECCAKRSVEHTLPDNDRIQLDISKGRL
jgi:hypothetical protein